MTDKGGSVDGGASSTTAEPVAEASPVEKDPTLLLGILQLVAGAGAVAAGIPYAILRIFLNIFYRTFGVTPEEVGWDSYTVLTRFAVPIAVLVLGVVFMVARVHAETLVRTGNLRGVFRTWRGRLTATAAAVGGLAMLAVFANEKASALRRGIPLSVDH